MAGESELAGIDVLRTEVQHIKGAIVEVKDTLKSINAAVQALVRVEQRQSDQHNSIERAFTAIADHEERLRTLENERGVHALVKNWVIAGVLGIVAIFGLQLIKLVG